MDTIRQISKGYYGILTDGISVDSAVASRIDSAFEQAKTCSLENLIVALRDKKTATATVAKEDEEK